VQALARVLPEGMAYDMAESMAFCRNPVQLMTVPLFQTVAVQVLPLYLGIRYL
jgi:hypothetical protein